MQCVYILMYMCVYILYLALMMYIVWLFIMIDYQ
nr:MAG TPA: copper transporter family protein [Caudoviricetes sp.]